MQNFNNSIYNIFNMSYVQQQAQQYHNQQFCNVMEASNKFRDFLDSCEKVAPEYQQELMGYCSAILIQKSNEKNRHY